MNKARMAITVALALSSSIALADSFQFQRGFYLGANTGASFVTAQTHNELSLVSTKTVFRDEASARGYNGGVFLGWNFYVDREYFYGFEASGNAYTNRAHQNFWNQTAIITPTSPLLNFEESWDMKYSADLTFHPGVLVSDSTALYAILGGSVAEIKTKLKRVSLPEHSSEDTDTMYGFVLGAGVQKQLCNRFSMFASYQYTYYGDHSLHNRRIQVPVLPVRQVGGNSINGVHHRNITVDSNVFKIGLLYTF